MSESQVKPKVKKNSKFKYEVSKPTFLITSKIDKFLQKKPRKIISDINNNNQKKKLEIKKKINLLQGMITKNKSPLLSNKQKNPMSKDKLKKQYINNNDKKYNIFTDKDNLVLNHNNINNVNYNNIKPSYQTISDNNNKKNIMINSFHTMFNCDHEQSLNDSNNYNGLKNNKDYYLNKMQKENNNSNSNKKRKYEEDDYTQDLTHRIKRSKLRNNDNYSMDKENSSLDRSINFNHIKEFKKGKTKKNRSAKNIIYPYNKSGDIKIIKKHIENLNNNIINSCPKNKNQNQNQNDKNLQKSLKMINEETSSIPIKYKSIVNSKKKIMHKEKEKDKDKDKEIMQNNEQNDVRHLENISKETPSTKNTIKNETRLTENIFNYKNNNNRLEKMELSIKHFGRKKQSVNRSANKIICSTNRHKMINNNNSSSIKYILDNKNTGRKNYSHENRNKYNSLNKVKNNSTNKNKNINCEKISKKLSNNSNITNSNNLELTSSPLIRNKNNINNKNYTKNIICLKKTPMNYQISNNSPVGCSTIQKEYDSTADIIKKFQNNKNTKKHPSFNLSRANICKIQNNENSIKNNYDAKNKTEKNSKTSTYKIKDKLNNSNITNNLNDNLKKKIEIKDGKDEKDEKEGEERECIPHVYSVTLRQSGFKQKEYPNMAKRLSSSQCDISIKDPLYENLKISNIVYKENKSIKIIESLCKKGFSGPGIKKTNQDNFFIFNNFNNNSNYIYMGVCDGHGIFGQDISSYLVNNLPQNLNNEFINKNIKNLSTEKLSTLSTILESTFIQTNINLNTDERIDSTFSGSTCVTALFTPTRLICINVGDSRCVMGKCNNNKWSSKNLTRDHKPCEPDEMDRVIAAGGKVEPYRDNYGHFVGPERVWKKEGDVPGLAMSRSFGDEIAHSIGVIVNPEINEYQFLNEDKFFILASDGIWEFISTEEVVNIVKDFYLENDIEGAMTYLYKEASKRWIMEEEVIDDITIILVFLN